MARVVVLPSPLLGPLPYQPLAEALRRRGHAASVAECPEPLSAAGVVEGWAAVAAGADALLAHSNAGYLAGSVAAAAEVGRVVYVDAALPPVAGTTRLAPPELIATLTELADPSGLLPPWTRWWSEEEARRVLPGVWFDRVDAVAPRVPLAYLASEHRPPSGWVGQRAGYLAFGTTYAAELELARDAGWPVAQLAGHHCWHLVRPDEVAAAVEPWLSR